MSTIKIGFTGDFCPWERVGVGFKSGNWQYMFDDVVAFFESNDFNILDLECPLTYSENPILKTGPHIKSAPQTASILKYLNCKHVATANNHFKDFGWEGMKDTYEALDAEGIQWIGSGRNIEEASKPIFIEQLGIKVAIINMTENEWSTTTNEEPGCNPLSYPRALSTVLSAKSQGADFTVVILHGGHEHYPLPSPNMKSRFRFMIDAGADAVVGHHTHIISGYEVYKGKPIFYSLGNFCFDWAGKRNSTWNIGLMLRLILSKNKTLKFEFQFVSQNNHKPGVYKLENNDLNEQHERIESLNEIIQDDDQLKEEFNRYCEGLKPIMLTRIQPYRNRLMVALNKRGILPNLIRKEKRKMLQILSKCESHREVLLYALNQSNTKK